MEKAHNHGTTSNTNEVFSTFIGCRAKGVLHFYNGHNHRALVFDCGWGLVFCDTGAYWTMSPEEVQKELHHARKDLVNVKKELEGILALAGDKLE